MAKKKAEGEERGADYGRRLRVFRQELELSQTTVAERMGITQGMYSKYEVDGLRITVPQLPLLAKGLGVPVTILSQRLGLAERLDVPDPIRRRFERITHNWPRLGRPARAAVTDILDVAGSISTLDNAEHSDTEGNTFHSANKIYTEPRIRLGFPLPRRRVAALAR